MVRQTCETYINAVGTNATEQVNIAFTIGSKLTVVLSKLCRGAYWLLGCCRAQESSQRSRDKNKRCKEEHR